MTTNILHTFNDTTQQLHHIYRQQNPEDDINMILLTVNTNGLFKIVKDKTHTEVRTWQITKQIPSATGGYYNEFHNYFTEK